ncbi:porin family protein [Chryseosolibacter indicus]|uniref:Outer membrane beta-barrel protein n=1 Tax=Chryseosolibacter indicus TaxID=2782351 RepID=A0ABS5VNW4_9BACT|nr:porin family protein [Chryseosolibacter indicus]MBT1702539.1 outer membrane beta-barrel protein [Chryseosolibacter indicus]
MKKKKMKNLKNLLFLGIVLFVKLNVSAQTSPLRFGIKTGLNLSSATVHDATGTNSKTGYHIGGTLEYSFSQKFLIKSGLLFSTKGSKIDQLNASSYIPSPIDDTHTFNASYLILPLHGAYRLNVNNTVDIVLGAGPYFGYGIGGKTTQKLNSGSWSNGSTENEWKTFGSGVYDENRNWLHGTTLKQLDIGIGATLDFEYQNFVLGIGYEQGLKNIATQDSYYKPQYKNRAIQASIGYKL